MTKPKPVFISPDDLIARATTRGKTLSHEDAEVLSQILGPNRVVAETADGRGDGTAYDMFHEFRDLDTYMGVYEETTTDALRKRRSEPREDVLTDLVVDYRQAHADYQQRLAEWKTRSFLARAVIPFPMPYGGEADSLALGGPVARTIGRVLRPFFHPARTAQEK